MDVLRLANVIILNEFEWNIINRYCPRDKIIIVTQGKLGATAHFQGHTISASPVPVRVVDSTGAGDAFCAGVLSGLLDKTSLQECLSRGCALAAMNSQKIGAHTAIITMAALMATASQQSQGEGEL